MSRFRVESTYVDTSDLENLRQAMRPEHQGGLRGIPLQSGHAGDRYPGAAAEIAHAAGALLVVDNTFASPYLQKPLDLGADVVLHSVTKFINGHADVVGGIVVAKTEALHKQLRAMVVTWAPTWTRTRPTWSAAASRPWPCAWSAPRHNAMEVAHWLERHPKVEWVSYLGLPTHPQYELARRQMAGPGAMISFEVKGGVEAGARLMDNVKLAALAVSLGGVETLICHPASMTHASMGREARLAGGRHRRAGALRGGHRGRGGPHRRPGAGAPKSLEGVLEIITCTNAA